MEQTEEEYDVMWETYDCLHGHCPVCGSESFATTLKGRHGECLAECKDTNGCRCSDCGWVGIRHDMV